MLELSNVAVQSENDEDQQTSENLGSIATYFNSLATFVDEIEDKINISVSLILLV